MRIDIHSHNTTECNDPITKSQPISDGKYTLGIHPFDAQQYTEQLLNELETLACDDRVFGIGEIGLDYRPEYRGSAMLQRELFAKQVEIANRVAKPIIVHQVRAVNDTIAILNKAHVPVIIHGFSGSAESAARFLNRGYYLSFGHMILTNTRLQRVLKSIPFDKMLLETDNKRECTIDEIYDTAAMIRGVSSDKLEEQIEKNYKSLFKIISNEF